MLQGAAWQVTRAGSGSLLLHACRVRGWDFHQDGAVNSKIIVGHPLGISEDQQSLKKMSISSLTQTFLREKLFEYQFLYFELQIP
jgi:hypothetical protein